MLEDETEAKDTPYAMTPVPVPADVAVTLTELLVYPTLKIPTPVTSTPSLKVVAPEAVRVPAIAVFPVPSATVNLLMSMVKPPFKVVKPVVVNVPAMAVFPLPSATVNLSVSMAKPP